MSENTQTQQKPTQVDQQEVQKKEVIPQQMARKSLIDLKKIQTDDPNHKNIIQNANGGEGTPSLQVIDEQQEKAMGQTSFGEAINQNQQDESTQNKNQQRNSININLQTVSQFSPKKGEYYSSLSPKRRMMQQGGANTPCVSPLPDLKVQRSKFDISQTQFFITNINAFRGLESFPKINELHNQISSIIDDLEGKLDTVVERHEADFLFAYRNHMSKIKQEMVDMKKQAEEQEKRLNDNDRVAGLERQIVWLRDECLELYKIIGKKKDDLSAKERTIRDLQKDNQHLQNQIKELMKKNRLLQMKIPIQGITNGTQLDNNNTQQSIIGFQEQINIQSPQQSPKGSQLSPKSQKIKQEDGNQETLFQSQYQESTQKQENNIRSDDEMYITQNIQISTIPQQQTQISPTNASSKRASLQNQNMQIGQQVSFEQVITKQQLSILEEANPEFGSQIISIVKRNIEGEISVGQLIHEISQYCKIVTDRKQKQYKQVKDKLEKTLKEKLKMGMARSDLETFFLECVETARKQIIKRKYVAGASANQTTKKGDQNQSNQNNIFQSPNRNMGDFVESIKDYKIFRSEDKVKILELLLSHEKLMMYLYQKIFPTHFNVNLQNALENQEELPLYLRPQKNSQNNSKYININDHQMGGQQQRNQENYLDLLTDEDPSIQNFQENILYHSSNQKPNDKKTKLPSLQESLQNQQILNLYQVNTKNKRNSVDHKGGYDLSNPSSLLEQSSALSKPSTQISRLGSLNNKYIQQRNFSQRNTNRSTYDAFSDQKNKSVSRNIGDSSFDDSKQISYNIHPEFQQMNGTDVKKQKLSKQNYNNRQNNQQVLSLTSPLTNPNVNSQENRIIQDKLNIVNGKLAFKNI